MFSRNIHRVAESSAIRHNQKHPQFPLDHDDLDLSFVHRTHLLSALSSPQTQYLETMFNLRSTILQNSLPHIPTHSFTLQPLKLALGSHLASLPPTTNSTFAQESSGSEGPDLNSAITHLFGSSPAPEKALVDVWEKEGLRAMTGSGWIDSDSREGLGSRGSGLGEVLGRRLRYSSLVGEHLVQVSTVSVGRAGQDKRDKRETGLI
jgi:hypothetical protein